MYERLIRENSREEPVRRTIWLPAVLMTMAMTLLITAIGWATSDLNFVKGDFTSYYAAATIVVNGQADKLYDLPTQQRVQQEIEAANGFPPADVLAFEYPPIALLPILPFAQLPLRQAYYLWAALNLILYAASLGLLGLAAPMVMKSAGTRRALISAALAYLPAYSALILGQLTFFALFFLIAGMALLRRERDFTAGLLFSVVAVKPQLILLFPLLVVAKGRGKALAGMVTGGVALLVMNLALIGPIDLVQLVHLNYLVARDYPATFNLTWLGFVSSLLSAVPEAIIPTTLALDCGTLWAVWSCWKGPWGPRLPRFGLNLGLLLGASTLVAPHLYPHDLLILVPAAFLIADYLIATRSPKGTTTMVAAMGVLFLVATYVDSYPLLSLPVRPLLVVMIAILVALFGLANSVKAKPKGASASTMP